MRLKFVRHNLPVSGSFRELLFLDRVCRHMTRGGVTSRQMSEGSLIFRQSRFMWSKMVGCPAVTALVPALAACQWRPY